MPAQENVTIHLTIRIRGKLDENKRFWQNGTYIAIQGEKATEIQAEIQVEICTQI